jgi:hypothetical protein
MLIHSNKTISVSRFVDVGWEKTRSIVKTWYVAYIQSKWEKVVDWLNSQWVYKDYIMMTDWIYQILIWDLINDWTINYVVDWWQIFSDLTWSHWQYLLKEIYD